MKSKCASCGEKDADGYGLINLEFKGISLRVTKEEKLTCEECFTKLFQKYLAKYRNLFNVVNEKVVFDWKTFCEKHENEEGERFQIFEVLLGLDILSRKCNGNYEIMSDHGIVLNPKFCMCYVWFREYKDAVRYAFAKYAKTEYNWHVRQIMGVWSRQDLIVQGYGK